VTEHAHQIWVSQNNTPDHTMAHNGICSSTHYQI